MSSNILAAVRKDLECFSDLQSLLLELPEEMCGVNPHHIAYMRDKECWNGTDRGRYVAIAYPIIIDTLIHNICKGSRLQRELVIGLHLSS